MCKRTPDGWNPPRKLSAPLNSPSFDWRPTIASGGMLYFGSDRSGGEGEVDIYRSVQINGEYRDVANLGPPVNSPHLEALPCPSPDESFLILDSWRPGRYGQGDLYVSYRRRDGSWTNPQNLGPHFNTGQIEDGGSISPDGKYFFFNRREAWVTEKQTDLHWVDIRAVFRPYVRNPAGEVSAVAGETLELRLPPDQFVDHDDDALVYSATGAGGDPLPAWLTFDPKTRTLTGTVPNAAQVAIEITASDPLGSTASDILTIRAH